MTRNPTENHFDKLVGPTISTHRGDKYYNQYRPQSEVCPRDHGKVVGTLQGSTNASMFKSTKIVLTLSVKVYGYSFLLIVVLMQFDFTTYEIIYLTGNIQEPCPIQSSKKVEKAKLCKKVRAYFQACWCKYS